MMCFKNIYKTTPKTHTKKPQTNLPPDLLAEQAMNRSQLMLIRIRCEHLGHCLPHAAHGPADFGSTRLLPLTEATVPTDHEGTFSKGSSKTNLRNIPAATARELGHYFLYIGCLGLLVSCPLLLLFIRGRLALHCPEQLLICWEIKAAQLQNNPNVPQLWQLTLVRQRFKLLE